MGITRKDLQGDIHLLNVSLLYVHYHFFMQVHVASLLAIFYVFDRFFV